MKLNYATFSLGLRDEGSVRRSCKLFSFLFILHMSVKTFFSKKLTAFQILHFKVSNCTFSLCIPSVQSQTAKMISSTICKCFKVLQFTLLQITHSNRTEYFFAYFINVFKFQFYFHTNTQVCTCVSQKRYLVTRVYIRNIFGNVFPKNVCF